MSGLVGKVIREINTEIDLAAGRCLVHPKLNTAQVIRIGTAVGPTLEDDERAEILKLKSYATFRGVAGLALESILARPKANNAQATKKPERQITGGSAADFEQELARHKGKYVLVDFWATWCPPCRESIGGVQAIAKEHKGRLAVIGVSLDTDKASLEAMLKSKGITFRQLFSGKGWDSEIPVCFGVRSIPHAMLYGPDGKIVAQGSPLEMEAKIDALMANQ